MTPVTQADFRAAAPKVSWDVFQQVFVWKQGEHTAFIGPTGSGKTTMAEAVLNKQPYVTALGTKPKDDSMDRLIASGYTVYKKWPTTWPKDSAEKYPRRVVWPKPKALSEKEVTRQAEVIRDAIASMYGEGGWCIYVDELWYAVNNLNIGFEIKTILLQARSIGISLAASTQRPAFVPLEIYDQSTHLFFWRDNDERNLARLSGISWRSANQVKNLIANLEKHEFLYVRNDGLMVRSKAEFPKGGNRK